MHQQLSALLYVCRPQDAALSVAAGSADVYHPGPCCSFFLCIQIVQARDLVESSLKPGSSALQLLGAMTPVIRKLGPSANPAILKSLPIAAAGWWAFYASELANGQQSL